ncbi:hypothetical protein JHK84_041068 [Glycine max]|nr:hypothetical protein JHK84_041068 [Glycine max]
MAEIVGPRLYCCCNCRNQVSLHDDIIAKTFQVEVRTYVLIHIIPTPFLPGQPQWFCMDGRYGRGFLFSHAMNIVVGPKEDRHLMTGLHTVADVYCGDCREVLGWKYERAYEASQKYKEGKFILEK